jgi:NADH dehydrogenase [ubiquinone] 1 alpha subcomplex assembly factor 7
MRIAAEIAARGPISLERYMALANAHYYATRESVGASGDFITAPEISQMFGEIVGLGLADLWQRAGAPPAHYVELGPGRGTLAADALRAMRVAGLKPQAHLVETSPLLCQQQRARVPDAIWHDTIDTLPGEGALLIVANEFFDALPIRQFLRTANGWRERLVDGAGHFELVVSDEAADDIILPQVTGDLFEQSPAALAIAEALGRRLATQGGVLLAIDYGHDGSRSGDTLQAVRGHAYADPFAEPGSRDLTAHVDFGALATALTAGGAQTFGPVEQGQWLMALGISDRAAALARRAPDRGEEIATAYRRLTDAREMGHLFKVLAAASAGWPSPAGFG